MANPSRRALSPDILGRVLAYRFEALSETEVGHPDFDEDLLLALQALRELDPDALERTLSRLRRDSTSAQAVLGALDPGDPLAEWRRVGVTSPLEAAAWEMLECDPGEAADWLRLGLGAGDFELWGQSGFVPEHAVVYEARGLSPRRWPLNALSRISSYDPEAVMAVAAFPDIDRRQLNDVLEWHGHLGDRVNPDTYKLTFPLSRFLFPEEAAEWGDDVELAEMLTWLGKGYECDAARVLRGDGVTAEVAPFAWLDENSKVYPEMADILSLAAAGGWRLRKMERLLSDEREAPWVRLTNPEGLTYKVFCDRRRRPCWVQVFEGSLFVGVLDPAGMKRVFAGSRWGRKGSEPVFAGVARTLVAEGWTIRPETVGYYRDRTQVDPFPATFVRVTRGGAGFTIVLRHNHRGLGVFTKTATEEARWFVSADRALHSIRGT